MNTEIGDFSTERKFYVYIHKRPDESVFYVGKGSGNRAWTKSCRNNHWHHIVEKHGSYQVEILEDSLTEQEALCLEVETIEMFGIENLANITLGGNGCSGIVHTEDTRKRMSEAHKQRYKDNPEELQKKRDILTKIHERVRNNKDARDALSKRVSDWWKNAPEEILKKISELRSENTTRMWQDEEKRKELSLAIKESWSRMSEEKKQKRMERLSAAGKEYFKNASPEQKARHAENAKFMKTPEAIAKYKEARQRKIVLNRKYIVESLAEYFRLLGKKCSGGNLPNSDKKYTINHGYFIEDYDHEVHCGLEEIQSLVDVEVLYPISGNARPISNSEGKIFLSLTDAAESIQSNATPITKQTSLTSACTEKCRAYGLYWFRPTEDEVETEIFRRLTVFLEKN